MKKGDKIRCCCKDNLEWRYRSKLRGLMYFTIKRIWYDARFYCHWVEFEECELHFSTIKIRGKNFLGDYFNITKEIRKMKLKQLFETNI